jgi:hypothetical protein
MAATSATTNINSVEWGEGYVCLGLNIIRDLYGEVNVLRYMLDNDTKYLKKYI